MNTTRLMPLALASLAALIHMPAHSDELQELRLLRDSTLQLVDLLVKRGVLSREDVAPLVSQAERAGAASQSAPQAQTAVAAAASASASQPADPKGVVRVQYVPDFVRQQIRDEVKQEVLTQAHQERWGEPGALPDWLSRISFDGDIRLRYQLDRFPEDNLTNAAYQQFQQIGQNVNNTTESRDRLRLRARFGLQAKVTDDITAGLRLATGDVGKGSDPNSTNQTLGNYFSRGTIGVDRAYLQYKPTDWLAVSGGRIANPYFSPTDLVWNENLGLDGLAFQATPQLAAGQGFLTVGAFPLQDIEPSSTTSARSKWLLGYQAGAGWPLASGGSVRVGAALFDYKRVEGTPNPNPTNTTGPYDLSAPLFRQKGNDLFDINQGQTTTQIWGLASRFRELNLSGSLDLATLAPTHVIVDADYVRNLGFKQSEILNRTGQLLDPQTKGYQAKLTIGAAKLAQRGDWQVFTGYRYLEADAVVDAFTDSDFHLGGTNAKGYFLGSRWGLGKGSYLGARWLSSKEITGLPLSIDTLQIDLATPF